MACPARKGRARCARLGHVGMCARRASPQADIETIRPATSQSATIASSLHNLPFWRTV